MFDFLNDCLSTIPDSFELDGKTITKDMVKDKGLILCRSGKLSNNPIIISSNLVGWSDGKTHTTTSSPFGGIPRNWKHVALNMIEM